MDGTMAGDGAEPRLMRPVQKGRRSLRPVVPARVDDLADGSDNDRGVRHRPPGAPPSRVTDA